MKRSNNFQHLVSLLQFPEQAKVNQEQVNKARLFAVERALTLRPHFLPVTHDLPAVAQNLPIPASTDDDLNYPVIITGAITDSTGKQADFFIERDNSKPIIRTVNNSRLSLEAFAGKNKDNAGFEGVLHFAEPFTLNASQSITLQIYNDTIAAAQVNTVFLGNRVYKPSNAEAQLSEETRRDVLENINKRPTPMNRFAVCPVIFAADGTATVETPKADEPLLILGFRSTFTNALVNFGNGTDFFCKKHFPLWALASEKDNGNRLFNHLNSPIFLGKRQQLLFSFKNRINDLLADNGQLEILMRTV
jgi:hypothetical protein